MNNLILVRHGQSIWNKEKKFTGFMDVELTEKGKSEAKHAGELIKKLSNILTVIILELLQNHHLNFRTHLQKKDYISQ